MTCTHVLGLIDAGPFADYPRAHLDAAWQHARQCPACGPALEAAERLTGDLKALAQPALPPELASVVMARIARIDQELAAPAIAQPEASAGFGGGDWSVQAADAGGLAAAVAIVMSMPPGGMPAYIAAPAVGGIASGLVAMPASGTYAVVLAAGLMLYAAGLFAPLTGGRRGRPRQHLSR